MSGSARSVVVPRAPEPVDIEVRVPGSKSLTNRALVCAALADGTSRVSHLAPGDDTVVMREILNTLGVRVDATPEGAADAVEVHGTGGVLPAGPMHLFAGLAGTTSRFITAMCALGPGPYVVDGLAALRGRPMAPLHQALRDLGVGVRSLEQPDHLPVEVTGPVATGRSRVALRGDISSQFLSAVMMIAPVLEDGLEIELTSPLVSRPYVEMTAAVMGAFGVGSVEVGESSVRIGSGGYRPTQYAVEPDASSASYPMALAAIRGGRVRVLGLGSAALQGDARCASVLAEMGCRVQWSADEVTVSRDPGSELRGIEIDMSDISDLVPTVAMVAAVAQTATRITGVGFIRHKESDRIGDLVTELAAVGVQASEAPDGLVIQPSGHTLRPSRVATHHDHRLAMAFGVLATAIGDVEIADPEVVSKSWPGFFTELASWCRSR